MRSGKTYDYSEFSYANARFSPLSSIVLIASLAYGNGVRGIPPKPSSMYWFIAYFVPPIPALTIAQSASATIQECIKDMVI